MDPGDGDYDKDGFTDNLNNLSVVAYITYGNFSMLLEGDAEKEAEKMLSGRIDGLTVMAAGHHGSSTSNTLLEEWDPDVFIISCEKGNTYGHPSEKVLARAFACGSEVYGTYRNGNILLSTRGGECTVRTEKGENMENRN